jgi:hypothetical protein
MARARSHASDTVPDVLGCRGDQVKKSDLFDINRWALRVSEALEVAHALMVERDGYDAECGRWVDRLNDFGRRHETTEAALRDRAKKAEAVVAEQSQRIQALENDAERRRGVIDMQYVEGLESALRKANADNINLVASLNLISSLATKAVA